MKTSIRILSLAVLALTMAACSNDTEQPTAVQPAPGNAGEGIPFSATIATGSATTRALTEENGTIISTWAKGEQVALIHNGVVDVMTIENDPDENGNVTITGTLKGSPKNNDDVTVVFPASAVDKDEKAVKADLLNAQDGTLATIATDLNLRQSDGAKLKVEGELTATLNGTVTLANQIAIVKFSLSDGPNALAAKQFVIKDGSDNVLTTVTPSEATSNLYVAMAPATTASTFKFEANVGDFTYTYEKSGVILEASTYYQSPIKMTISKKAGEISFATTSISKTFGDEPFINEPTMTGDGTVTYSSSDTKVAEVNATTGEVTIKGDGVAIIKATVTDGPTYTYATNEASYTLGVGTATMTVTAEGYSGTYDGNTHGISVKAPDGATIKYGTTADDYDLDASPAYRDAGTYTVYYKVTMPGFTIVTGSATVTIEKASGTISFDTATPKEALHAAAADNTYTQEVTKTGDGTVTYTISDNTCGATIDASTGKVTFTQAGCVTITATVADGTNYTYATTTATYTLSVSDTTDGSGGVPDNDDYTGGGNPF
jgi:hypothetical protein